MLIPQQRQAFFVGCNPPILPKKDTPQANFWENFKKINKHKLLIFNILQKR
jgi:hypothetical protein